MTERMLDQNEPTIVSVAPPHVGLALKPTVVDFLRIVT